MTGRGKGEKHGLQWKRMDIASKPHPCATSKHLANLVYFHWLESMLLDHEQKRSHQPKHLTVK